MNEPNMITREELYERIWKLPATKLAKELGISDVALAKICRKLNVPKPGPGYWRLIQLGWEIQRPPLPALSADVAKAGAVIDPEPHRTRAEKKPAAKVVPAESGVAASPEEAAERGVLDIIRQATRISFWRESISKEVYPGGLTGWLEVDAVEKVLERVVKNVRGEYRTFRVGVKDAKDRYGQEYLQVNIVLREGCEWKEAWEEAWTFAKQPNPHCLSDNALRLYLWAKGPKNIGKVSDVRRIGAQARLRKTYSDIEDHMREIRAKADASIQWETSHGQVWRTLMRVWFEDRKVIYYHHGPLNPALGLNLRAIEHNELERFRSWLHAEILKPGFPDGGETVGVFDIRDRRTLKSAFSELPDSCGIFAPDTNFFRAVRLIEGVMIAHEFVNGMGPWIVVCRPEKDVAWSEIKERLRAKAAEIPLGKKYKLSRDGLALLKWIVELRGNEYSRQMTPPVEDLLEKDIGIEAEWDEENTRALVEVLIEEINEQTDFHLRAVPWRECGEVHTRILVKKKSADLDGVVRAIQVFGLGMNKILDGGKITAAISALVSES